MYVVVDEYRPLLVNLSSSSSTAPYLKQAALLAKCFPLRKSVWTMKKGFALLISVAVLLCDDTHTVLVLCAQEFEMYQRRFAQMMCHTYYVFILRLLTCASGAVNSVWHIGLTVVAPSTGWCQIKLVTV